jgi:hypothetical protein
METTELEIGGIRLGIDANPPLAARLRRRYGGFVQPKDASRGAPRLRIDARLAAVRAVPDTLPGGRLEEGKAGRLFFRGDCSASLDLEAGTGSVTKGDGLAGVDTLVRLSLSLLAPAEGWALLHGAAVELESGGWALLLGESGAGKSTAARSFVSFCDELALARGGRSSAEAASTPYWNGTPGIARCEAIVCLERSETPGWRVLRGSEAARALLPHLVRHVRREEADRALLGRLLELAEGVPVLSARLITGESYVGRLAAGMERHGFAPRWRMARGAEEPALFVPLTRQGGLL